MWSAAITNGPAASLLAGITPVPSAPCSAKSDSCSSQINHGRIILSGPLDELKESHRTGGRIPSLNEIFVTHAGMTAASIPDA